MFNTLNKKDCSLLLGNALDQFETALYGFLTPILSPLFFPGCDPVVQLILGYSILATGLITRPLGALIFGGIAKRFGPNFGLSYSILGVAMTTLSIALLPSFLSIGWLAPCLLLLLRILKGIFGAGECTIARLSILEAKEKESALKASYYYETSTMVGVIVASFVATGVIASQYQAFAWRLCFILGGILGITAYFIRRSQFSINLFKLEKSELPQFCNTFIDCKILWEHRFNILRIFSVCSFSYLTYAVPFLLFNTLVPLISSISLKAMMTLNTTFLVLDMLLIPIIGRAIERYDINKVMLIASLILSITMIPFFMLLPDAPLIFVTFFRFWIVFWGIVFLCPLNLWFNRLLENSPDRFLVVGIGDALGAGTIGHMSPAICLWLWHATSSVIPPAIFIAIVMLCAAISIGTSAIFVRKSSLKALPALSNSN